MNTCKSLPGLIKTTALAVAVWGAASALADPPYTSATVYPSVPPNISTSGSKPMLMLTASKDHTLFAPIYTDFEDLDGDGIIDVTFKPDFKYYGYFDATKCYLYQNSRFEPSATATAGSPAVTATNAGSISTSGGVTTFTDTTHGSGTFTTGMRLTGIGVLPNTFITGYVTGTGANNGGTYIVSNDYTGVAVSGQTIGGGASIYRCGGSGQWSGNFLNWATMSRLDIVRKMLYGGQRSTDTSTDTVLQMARLSQDSHSFVKYYRGTDIRDYTPFTTSNLTKTTGSNANVYAGLSICSRASANDDGRTSTPTMRMAKGNYRLWATVEGGTVCNWSGTFGEKLKRYYGGNTILPGQTITYQGNGGVWHEANPPDQTTDGATYSSIGPDLNVRVKVCDSTMLGEERCQAYGSGSSLVYKPVGLLQDFGTPVVGATAARTEFGLITGSYDKNLTAGTLRKNMTDMSDEINPTTGQFCFSGTSTCSGTLTGDSSRTYTSTGTIRALDQIILYGKTSGNYSGSNVQLPSEMTNGTLAAWGNPVGEMIVQALRYYAGQSSTNPSSTSNDTGVSVPVATWVDPMAISTTVNTTRTSKYGKPICRPLNILALSSSALGFDYDDADTVFADLPNRSRGTLSEFTDAVGVAEGIQGTVRSVGSVSSGFGETCSGKTVTALSSVTGVCPEAPAVGGSYKVAGAALYANTNRIRTPSTLPSDMPNWGLKVKTYAASLGGGTARIEVQIPGTGTSTSNPPKFVYITPEGLWAANSNTKRMPAAFLTFASISSSSTHGAFIVTWNDSQFGGDYDMDIAGYLRYDILTPLSPSTRYRLKVTTDIINVGAGWTGSHGFSIMGSNGFDGRYLTHRHMTSDSMMSSAEGYLCGIANYRGATNLATATLPSSVPPIEGPNGNWACNVHDDWDTINNRGGLDSPVTLTFEMLGASSVTVRDPLWYAAKYGAFTPTNATSSTELPDTALEWDARRNDGIPCGGTTGVSCQDGEPDGYFLARRPELLEKQLRDTLETIISTTNSAPAVSSSQLTTGGYKYVATFEPSQNSGSILAYALNSNGHFSNTPNWDTGQKLTTVTPSSRVVITNDGNVGKVWRTSTTFSTDFTTALLGSGTAALTTAQGNELVDYLRGDRTKEKPAGIWRARSISNIMGTVVNSSPWLQPRPMARNVGTLPSGSPSYASFITAQKTRERVIWVGANDGLLHGFQAVGSDGGAPVMSYIPSPMVSRLSSMAQDSTQIVSGMDGSPFTSDVLVGSTPVWKTYLFSSLGRGGKAVYALDVTTASTLTETNASSIYKWMFSVSDDSDLGYVMSDHQLHPVSNQAIPVVRMNNDKYAILVPNGLGSTNGRAYLFVLFVDGPNSGTWTAGTHYIKIPTDTLGSNGLMGVNWADINNDGKADIIYCTDVWGRLWKFDVSSATPSNWQSAFLSGTTPIPLFEAYSGTQRLAVSTSPVLSFPDFGGIMVGYGTGRSISSGDFPNASYTQRFFSVYDRLNWTSPSRSLPNSNLSTMLRRTMKRASNGDVYVSEAGSVAFSAATHDGWYINFAALASGSTTNDELVLSSPKPIGGQIYIKTVRSASTSTTNCYSNPQSADYLVDPITGLPNGMLGTMDVVVDGVTKQVYIAGKDSPDQKSTVNLQVSDDSGSGGGGGGGGVCGGNKNGTYSIIGKDGQTQTLCFLIPVRRQWREISGMRTDQ